MQKKTMKKKPQKSSSEITYNPVKRSISFCGFKRAAIEIISSIQSDRQATEIENKESSLRAFMSMIFQKQLESSPTSWST